MFVLLILDDKTLCIAKSFSQIKFHKVLHDPAENKACFHATSTGDTPFDDWNMEYVGFVTFSEDGTEVVKLEEFVDSSRMADFGPKLHEYLKGQKK